MFTTRRFVPAFTLLAAATLVIGACGGDGAPKASPSSTNERDDEGNSDSTGTPDATGTPSGDADCAGLREAFGHIGVTVQLLPQIQSVDQVTDTFVISDLDLKRAAIDQARTIANAEANAFLDDIEAGLNALEAGRNGDAEAAVTEIQTITGGVDGVGDWLARQLAFNDSLTNVGC
jgi:hypothetical protein